MSRWLKIVGILLATLVGAIAVLVMTLGLVSVARERRTYPVTPVTLTVPTDSSSIARGRHLATALSGCMDCHGADLGGKLMGDDPLFGRLVSANLTRGRGGIGATYSDADYVHAIRYGVGRDHHSLIFMPSDAFQAMSDADLGSVIAFVKAMPPVDRELPRTRPGVLARALHVAAGFPLLSAEGASRAAEARRKLGGKHAPAAMTTVEYGEYLATAGGCRGCHGPDLAGAHCPNITPGVIGSWSETGFKTLLRKGVRPNGVQLSSEMPWQIFSNLTDEEMTAIYLFVRSVPAKAPKKS